MVNRRENKDFSTCYEGTIDEWSCGPVDIVCLSDNEDSNRSRTVGEPGLGLPVRKEDGQLGRDKR